MRHSLTTKWATAAFTAAVSVTRQPNEDKILVHDGSDKLVINNILPLFDVELRVKAKF